MTHDEFEQLKNIFGEHAAVAEIVGVSERTYLRYRRGEEIPNTTHATLKWILALADVPGLMDKICAAYTKAKSGDGDTQAKT